MAHPIAQPTLVGKTIDLRPIEVRDAGFVLALRLDPQLNAHLSATAPAVDRQVEWIRQCIADPGQYYYVVEDKAATPVGTIRVYDIRADSFCWGSWILRPGAPRKAAIESALLVYEFGFYRLGFDRCHFDVRKKNTRVVDFHRRFGARAVGETEDDLLFDFTRLDYEAVRPHYAAFLPLPCADSLSTLAS